MPAVDAGKLRYAILLHGGIDEPHYDLMFETRPGSDLATWRSPSWPIEAEAELTRLRDHRRIYLDFQGELSFGRGSVTRVAEGTCDVRIDENSIWMIQLDTGIKLQLSLVQDDRWRVVG
jgi:hypothetical protein